MWFIEHIVERPSKEELEMCRRAVTITHSERFWAQVDRQGTRTVGHKVRNILRKMHNGDEQKTIGYTKIVEMLSMPISDTQCVADLIVDPSSDVVRTLHLAEFPGAMIMGTGDLLSNMGYTHEWIGNSLPPGDGEILDDEFGLYKDNEEQWVLQDIMSDTMISETSKKFTELPTLITGDLGKPIDAADFTQTELLHTGEHSAQYNVGKSINPNAVCIFKFYGGIEEESWDGWLEDAMNTYDAFICKPYTSKSRNDELYAMLIPKSFNITLPPRSQSRVQYAKCHLDTKMRSVTGGHPIDDIASGVTVRLLSVLGEQ